ncbi:MAG TPA: hypothetical protein VFV19_01650 [Candidatus Polarisedimenticolaceae bacterium]|nr:hypothetical protein [Candidatus Polarisedimenticolaceae bacterium]
MTLRRLLPLIGILALTALPALARVDVTLDAATLNELLSKLAPDHVPVDLHSGKTLNLQLKDVKVTGFDPAAGPNGGILTSLRLIVPELNLDSPVTPRLTLDVKDAGGKKVCFLKFDKVNLTLPIMGAIDVGPLLPPLPILPDKGWEVDSANGPMEVTPKLIDAKTGAQSIRVGFDLVVGPATGGTAGR